MNHTHPFGIVFWIGLFLEYFIKSLRIFKKNHDNFFNSILISLALKICQNLSFRKTLKLLNMSFYYLNALAIMFY